MYVFGNIVATVDLMLLFLFSGVGILSRPHEKELKLACGFISSIALVNLLSIVCR